jgi:hypothetical protein
MKKFIVLAIAVIALALPCFAQQTGGTQTSQQAQHFDAAVQCASLDAASGSATLAAPQSGYSWYVTWIDANVGATGTVTAAAPVKATTAGTRRYAADIRSLPIGRHDDRDGRRSRLRIVRQRRNEGTREHSGLGHRRRRHESRLAHHHLRVPGSLSRVLMDS